MCRYFAYMRISTQEDRHKQKYTRQESAIAKWCKENDVQIPDRRIFKDDASGKSFDRPQWHELMTENLGPGDTIVFKDICRFTRECDNGFDMYMKLLNEGIELIFIDNPTVSTPYIKNMMDVAKKQENRIAKKSLKDTIELLLLVELDRAEQERLTTAQRIKDGIAASDKKCGRQTGHLDKMTPELRNEIRDYVGDRKIRAIDLMRKHGISRNTFKKYVDIVEKEMKAQV